MGIIISISAVNGRWIAAKMRVTVIVHMAMLMRDWISTFFRGMAQSDFPHTFMGHLEKLQKDLLEIVSSQKPLTNDKTHLELQVLSCCSPLYGHEIWNLEWKADFSEWPTLLCFGGVYKVLFNSLLEINNSETLVSLCLKTGFMSKIAFSAEGCSGKRCSKHLYFYFRLQVCNLKSHIYLFQ